MDLEIVRQRHIHQNSTVNLVEHRARERRLVATSKIREALAAEVGDEAAYLVPGKPNAESIYGARRISLTECGRPQPDHRLATATTVDCSISVNVKVMNPTIMSSRPVTPRLLTDEPSSNR